MNKELPKLILNLYPRDPVYFAVRGHRYRLEGIRDDELYYDELAAPNLFTLLDVESGDAIEFSGRSAADRLCHYPLEGGTTIQDDENAFDYVIYDGRIKDCVRFRVLVSSCFSKGFFDRLHGVCDRLGMRLLCETCVPYWKIDGLDEIGVVTDRAPNIPYEKWTEIFEFLFYHKDYHIEGFDTSGWCGMEICRYTTPEETEKLDEENYFVIMGISDPCFTGDVPYCDIYGKPLKKS